jgi:hypothetical protein
MIKTRAWRDPDAVIVEGDDGRLFFVGLDDREAHEITQENEQNIYSRGGWTDEVPTTVADVAASILSKPPEAAA